MLRNVRAAAPSRLRIPLGPSRRLAALFVAAHLLAALGVLASTPPSIIAAVLLPTLAANLWYSLRRHAWLTAPRSLVLLDFSDTLEVAAEERSGRRIVATVLGTTFVAPWLVVLNLEVEGDRFLRTVVVMPDATARESFRAVRVWLRWRHAATGGR